MKFSLEKIKSPGSFFLIAGPCVIESFDLCLEVAQELKRVGEKLNIPCVFKASFDKANRTSGASFRGPGLEQGLQILADVKSKTGLPLLTDIHWPEQAKPVAEVCDILQIPAFLCRQTDLTLAAAAEGKPVNIKKGQFMSPWAMKNLVSKIRQENPDCKVFLTERGASFGYGDLVVDMRSFQVMSPFCDAVIYDATHSLQVPATTGTKTGGQREFLQTLASAAMATGYVDGIFLEAHPEPAKSPSDAENILPLEELESLIAHLLKIKRAVS